MEEDPGLRASRRSCGIVHGNIRDLQRHLSDMSLDTRGDDVVFYFFPRLLSLPDVTFPSCWFRVLIDRCSCSKVRLIGYEGSSIIA